MHTSVIACMNIYIYTYIRVHVLLGPRDLGFIRCRKTYIARRPACMYVGMHACMRACMHTCMYVRIDRQIGR